MQLRRPIKTRFRFASTYRLKLAAQTNSLTHYTKGTLSRLRARTACKHSVSGTLSLPALGFFSPFPHGTCSLSVTEEYLGLEGGPPMFRQDFTCPALLESYSNHLPVRDYHPLRSPFPKRSGLIKITTGLVRVRSPLLTEFLLISFPLGTEMFQFPRFAPTTYLFSCQYTLRCGFPHSDISGSMSARNSPELIAACYVLHRLSVPRHPPNALVMLDPYQKPDFCIMNSPPIRQGVGSCSICAAGLTTLIYARPSSGGRT